jgi:aminopeptidase N
MSINDPLVHPALLDPRLWAESKLYDSTFNCEREPVKGEEHHTPNRTFSIKHLKLELRFDQEHHRISGTATFTIIPINDGLRDLQLDIAEMEISSVKLLRVEKRATGDLVQTVTHLETGLEFETLPEKLSIELDRAYARSDYLILQIAYSCSPRKGLFFVEPDDHYPDKPRQIWSQGENEDAHWWFPCHDLPNQKMSTELIAHVKSDYFALSNGELIDLQENSADRIRTFHWRQTQPHPAYLVSVVIGKYEQIRDNYEGLPVEYYLYPNRVESGRKLFANTPRMIEFFEDTFSYAFPFSKYSQVLVDDFLFSAMENTTATTMTDRCLLDQKGEIDIDYDDIVAHELAHQWWGNLVTCKDWTQVWLNESFATYSEYLWREHTRGRNEARFALYQDFLTYLREDLTSHRRPIAGNRYRFSEEVMDRHAYEKGACVVDMLRWVIGDNPFFLSLSNYLNKFEFSVAETNDFKVSIEETTGQNLHWFFDQWIYGCGYPELEVSYQWERDQKMLRLSVRQIQEAEDGTPLFRFPVEVEIITMEAEEIIETERRINYRIMIEKAEQDFYFPCDSRPKLVIFDKHNRIIKLMRFPKSSQELAYQLAHDDDVMGRVRAARELSAFKGEDAVRVLGETVVRDDFYGVRMAAAISLGEIGTESARQSLISAYGLNSDSHVRRCCILAMGNFKNGATQDFLHEALDKDESYFVGVAAVRALAHLGGEKAYDILASSLSRTSWQEVIAAAVFHGFGHNIAWAKDKRAVNLAIEHSRYGRPPTIRVAAINCLGSLGKELNKEKASDRIVDHLLEFLKDKHIRTRVAAIRALGKVGDKRALAPLRESQKRECLDMIKAALLDAIEELEKKS